MKLNEAIKWTFVVGLLYIVFKMMSGGFSGYQFNMPMVGSTLTPDMDGDTTSSYTIQGAHLEW